MAVKLCRLHCGRNVGWLRLRLNDLLLSPRLRRRAFCVWVHAYVSYFSHYTRVAFVSLLRIVYAFIYSFTLRLSIQQSWIRVLFDQLPLTSLALSLAVEKRILL